MTESGILVAFSKSGELANPNCRMSPLGLNPWIEGNGRLRHLLQAEDHSGNGPRSVPDFLRSCSGLFPERFRIVLGHADSREVRLT